jgi:hypothetical protein
MGTIIPSLIGELFAVVEPDPLEPEPELEHAAAARVTEATAAPAARILRDLNL